MSLKHSDEFKRDTVRSPLTSGLTRRQVASDLSVGLSTLGKWIASVSNEVKIPARDSDLLRENERLRKENRLLREEREILKKAAVDSTCQHNINFQRLLSQVFSHEEKIHTIRKEICWSLWRQGLGFSDIGRVLDARPGSVFTLLRENGGVTLPTPKRSQRHLNLAQREEISISLAANISIRQIACSLHRSPSTISREINKNGGIGKYRANIAEATAWKRAKRPKPAKLAINILLKSFVIEKLQLKWSPEQISGWLKIEFPFHRDMQISPETIYKSLYIRSRKLLDIALMNNLRRAHKIRQSKRHSRRGDRGTISIVNGISIHKCHRDR